MNFYQITVVTREEAVEAISEAFMELDCGGVEIFDPDDILTQTANSLNWDYMEDELREELEDLKSRGEVRMRCYFSEEVIPNQTALEDLVLRIREKLADIARFLPIGTGSVDTSFMAEETWANEYKKYYKPFRLGKHIHIVPTWIEEEAEEGDIFLRLDPGMAFGTGTHETTSLCITTLEEDVKAGMDVLDIGTGSGILSIVADKLGAGRVIGTDLDPAACDTARENVVQNGSDVEIYCGDLTDIPELAGFQADIVVANIMADIIMLLAPKALPILKDGGLFICSGILAERRDEVADFLASHGYEILRTFVKGGWSAIEAQKR